MKEKKFKTVEEAIKYLNSEESHTDDFDKITIGLGE